MTCSGWQASNNGPECCVQADALLRHPVTFLMRTSSPESRLSPVPEPAIDEKRDTWRLAAHHRLYPAALALMLSMQQHRS